MCAGDINVMASPRCMVVKRFRRSPTPKYGIVHMKLAGTDVAVFLVNHDLLRHVYFAMGNRCY